MTGAKILALGFRKLFLGDFFCAKNTENSAKGLLYIYIGLPLKTSPYLIVFLAGYTGKNAPKCSVLAQKKNPVIPKDHGIAEQD